ncbi:conserved hypothetical protein [Betalipothrixvirus acidiani]|uniref:Uncharacterized protein n=1 Tax=Betalipothrixvirus acidiani TaxID=346881 RepID=A7WK87_9VIRU|nr:virion structural protein [Acidianus filamentous virus 3]CAL69587.1 conserved hypothetical protein [Acidianus filamentous virus 3]
MVDEFEFVRNMIETLKSSRYIVGYAVDRHVLNLMIEMFIENTGKDYEYAFKKIVEVLHELGYNVTY